MNTNWEFPEPPNQVREPMGKDQFALLELGGRGVGGEGGGGGVVVVVGVVVVGVVVVVVVSSSSSAGTNYTRSTTFNFKANCPPLLRSSSI